MPNHCINELIFHGIDTDARGRILAALCKDGAVDFSVLVPKPLNLWDGNVGSSHTQAFGRTGLDWAKENWGTKWNAYGHRPTEQTDDSLTLRFETAWSPPYPWLAAVLNSLSLPFEHNWIEEGRNRGVAGTFKPDGDFAGGPTWQEMPAPDELHLHLHKLLWGVEQFEDEDEAA